MKYLLLGLLAYIAWRWYVAQKPGDGEPAAQSSPPPPAPGGEKMVSCSQCGIHLPESEAVAGPGLLQFCSNEHQQEYASRRSS